MLMQNNADMTRTHKPRFTNLRPCVLDRSFLLVMVV